MDNQYCVIGIYFGTLRSDFALWLKSCEANSDIDFILITDANCSNYNLPNNVFLYTSTLQEVKKRASKMLGFEVSLDFPYKLCDFRPAFGIIFQDLIEKYSYWGHCDFDMMFGRISYFFETYRIHDYIHFLTQGHLSLYKNEVNIIDNMFLKGSPYDAKTVFTSKNNFAFDENYGIGKIYKRNNIPQFEKNIYADISPVWKRLRRSPYYIWDVPPKDYKHQLFIWEKGRTYWIYIDENGTLKKEEVLYLHYQKRKLNIDNIKRIIDSDIVVITPSKFIPWEGDLTKEDIYRLNPYSKFNDTFYYMKWKINKQWKRMKLKLKK